MFSIESILNEIKEFFQKFLRTYLYSTLLYGRLLIKIKEENETSITNQLISSSSFVVLSLLIFISIVSSYNPSDIPQFVINIKNYFIDLSFVERFLWVIPFVIVFEVLSFVLLDIPFIHIRCLFSAIPISTKIEISRIKRLLRYLFGSFLLTCSLILFLKVISDALLNGIPEYGFVRLLIERLYNLLLLIPIVWPLIVTGYIGIANDNPYIIMRYFSLPIYILIITYGMMILSSSLVHFYDNKINTSKVYISSIYKSDEIYLENLKRVDSLSNIEKQNIGIDTTIKRDSIIKNRFKVSSTIILTNNGSLNYYIDLKNFKIDIRQSNFNHDSLVVSLIPSIKNINGNSILILKPKDVTTIVFNGILNANNLSRKQLLFNDIPLELTTSILPHYSDSSNKINERIFIRMPVNDLNECERISKINKASNNFRVELKQ